MAWLTNLAGKAEDLLNRLDQNASLVLQNETDNHIPESQSVKENSINGICGTSLLNEDNNVTIDQESVIINDNRTILSNSGVEPSRNCKSIQTSPKKILETKQINPDNLKRFYLDSQYTDVLEEHGEQAKVTQDLEKRNEELESKYVSCQNNVSQLNDTLTECQYENTLLQKEIEEKDALLSYTQEKIAKHRSQSQKILKEKDRIIAQIQNTPIVFSESNEQIENISKLMKTRDDQQKTIDDLNEKLELIQNDLLTTQEQCSLHFEEAQTARKALQEGERIRMQLEDELRNNKQELKAVNEILQKNLDLLNAKNEELVNLQQQVNERTTSAENEALESKFHVLTKTLIMKQNCVETLTTERNALRLQLERIENEHSRVLSELNTRQTCTLNVDQFDEGKTPNIFTMSPFDEGVTRRVKQTISTLNSFSIRLGVFLRRYPVARVFLLCYMILLQIWVVVILFAYVPTSN